MEIKLEPIRKDDSADKAFWGDAPLCSMVQQNQIQYYNAIGFTLPWIGYFALADGKVVGTCSFKGSPKNGKVEIAYFTFPEQEGKGYGKRMCAQLVNIAKAADPQVIVTARTLPQHSPSTSILKNNGFTLQGIVMDSEDGEVWEWVLK